MVDMAGAQRDPATGKGVPGTACADDMFTRFDQLTDVEGPGKDNPVRWYLGFLPAGQVGQNNQVSKGGPRDVQFNKFVAKVDAWMWPGKDAGFVERALRYTAILWFNAIIWTAGFIADQLITLAALPDIPNKAGLRRVLADMAQKSIVCQITGQDKEWSTQVDIYARNYLCPTLIVPAAAAVSCHLHDIYTEEEMIDYGRANGLCDQATRAMFTDGQTRLAAADYEELYRRQYIGQPVWAQRMRELGF